jgi:hypothetical protein
MQTDEVPVEKAVQIPDEAAAQTAEFKIISSDQDQEEKWFFSTVFQLVGSIMTYLEDEIHQEGWHELVGRLHYTADKMIEAGYPLPVAPRRSKRHRQPEPFLVIPAFKKKLID